MAELEDALEQALLTMEAPDEFALPRLRPDLEVESHAG